MKKQLFIGLMGLAPLAMYAQSAVDAYNMSPSELRGTARFMSMGGAFTALGGDLSTLNQNPAGIGIYRSSEIGVTLDVDFQSTKTNSGGFSLSNDQTKAACNNFGYIGAINTGSDVMPFFSWGASYGRVASFDRVYKGGTMLTTSLSNYIANFTSGQSWASPEKLLDGNGNNPYLDGNADWLSILAYNGYMINPLGNSNYYNGLWEDGVTYGDAMFQTRQKGYVDEYAIDFGGNIMNTVFWGIGFGITDLNFRSETYYDEQLTDAQICNSTETGVTRGDAWYGLSNWQQTTGSGFNFKAGLIFKPVNELRIGVAVHTPTYYNMTTSYDARVDYSYSSGIDSEYDYYPAISEVAFYDWKMNSPWRLMAGVAGVLGSKAIISVDYEYQGYNDMSVKDYDGYSFDAVNDDIDNYYQASNNVRVGLEYRITPQLSVRGGFNYTTTNVTNEANDNKTQVYTSGTNPSYVMDKDSYYITGGLGYRYKGFYADAAYVYRHRESTWHGFTPYDDGTYFYSDAPTASVEDNNHHLVLSVGYKF